MEIVRRIVSTDGKTIKFVQKLQDGLLIETTYVYHGRKHIVCFSSQAGCSVGCQFCASGLRVGGTQFMRSLTKEELVEQCINVVYTLGLESSRKTILFSCMGEGEPFLNLRNVARALRVLGGTFPRSRLAVSTSGISPRRICQLARVDFPVPFKLQVSIHAPNDAIRRRLITVSRPVKEIVDAVAYYRAVSGREVEWNYLLFAGVNDSRECAEELAALLGRGAYVKFNTFNAVDGTPLVPVRDEVSALFRRILERRGLRAEYYATDGNDINAACGQLFYRVSS